MKSKTIAVALSILLAAVFSGCQGIQASTDNAKVKGGLHYGANGKLTDKPEISVPIWSSKKLKQMPEEGTPAKN